MSMSGGARILVVEDDNDINRLLCDVVHRAEVDAGLFHGHEAAAGDAIALLGDNS
jgi:DNA-binding response OmpR family regulator